MIIIDGSNSGASNFTIATGEGKPPKGIRLVLDPELMGTYQYKLESIMIEMARTAQRKWKHLA